MALQLHQPLLLLSEIGQKWWNCCRCCSRFFSYWYGRISKTGFISFVSQKWTLPSFVAVRNAPLSTGYQRHETIEETVVIAADAVPSVVVVAARRLPVAVAC
jgi:hypothetical protein